MHLPALLVYCLSEGLRAASLVGRAFDPILGEQVELLTFSSLESDDLNSSPTNDRIPEIPHDVERIEYGQWIPRMWSGKALNASSIPRFPWQDSATRISVSLSSVATLEEMFCDFGPLPSLSLCEWQNGNAAIEWMSGSGLGTNWVGGPPSDATTGMMEGGYAFMETSQPPSKTVTSKSPGALLHSPQLGSTGAAGTCITFKYLMDGLSIAGLRILLKLGVDEYSIKKEPMDELLQENVTASFCENKNKVEGERVLWHAHYYDLGMWQQGQILYTYPDLHSIIFEGFPVDVTDPLRLYEGYIAIDDIDFQPGISCMGFCNFAASFCDWSNDAEDDFDWTISRGSRNPTTGPAMDSSSDRLTASGYAYIDSSFPRRSGDKARLISTSFPATAADQPMCIHFSFHMFGSGIGSLKIYLRHFRELNGALREVWGLSGNAGNAWFASQVAVGSLDDFQLIFEASVGNTGMGDIAIDDISFTHGACPVYPQVAAPIPRDCTFEVDECEWINSRDSTRIEWERVSSQVLSIRNQRKPYTNEHVGNRRNEYFLALARSRNGPRSSAGGMAQLVSRQMSGSTEPLCISFWYIMFEPFIDSSGPSLGVLRVYVQPNGETSVEPRPIWQLYNDQGPTWNYAQMSINEKGNFNIIFEGIWGPNRANGNIGIDDISFYTGNCTVKPAAASVRSEDCSFEKGLCGWENVTLSDNERTVAWQRAFLTHRPAQLLDKTFWFAAFGVEESTTLQIIRTSPLDSNGDEDEEDETENGKIENLWSLTAKGFNDPRPVWTPAQVTVNTRSSYRLVLKGTASNGGFAIDDVSFRSRACPIRPPEAQPTVSTSKINDDV